MDFSFLEKRKKSPVQSIVVESPCTERWDDMTGNDVVRFCDRCNLNVHNLTSMSERDAEKLIASKPVRPCVYFYRRENGAIVTDNCPKALRPIRNRISAYACAALLTFSWCIALNASAQGIVGAPVDPRYGTAILTDYGYDTARDIARLVTGISFLIVLFLPLDESKKDKVDVLVTELIGLAAIPFLVHITGNYIINNFGGLGGGI